MDPDEIHALGAKAKQRIADAYSWQHIADQYKNLFLNGNADSSGSAVRA